jgi:cytidylate kinase
MPAQVVCISRADAALGEEIGKLVAERMSFRYVDEEVIQRAAQLAQVDPAVVAKVEARQPLLRALLERIAAAGDLMGPATMAMGVPVYTPPSYEALRATPDDLRALIQAAIGEIAREGRAVIVAHAASMTLAMRGDVLRVSVTASPETRARRLADARGISATDAAAAITTSDRNRRDYFRRFYKIDEELPTYYDLVINTDVLTPEHGAELIVSAAKMLRVPAAQPNKT